MNTIICPHCKKTIDSVQYELNEIKFGTLKDGQIIETSSQQPDPTKYYCPECEEEISNKIIKNSKIYKI